MHIYRIRGKKMGVLRQREWDQARNASFTEVDLAEVETVKPNQAARGELLVHQTASGQKISVPFLYARGKQDGPTLWINGGVHGDEVNGSLAAIEFFRRAYDQIEAGRLFVTPVSNVLALDERRKVASGDNVDMDQSFPGRANGLITERIAAQIYEEFGKRADYIVNLHTLGTPFDALPYAVYKLHPLGPSEAQLLKLINYFKPTFACRMPIASPAGELPGNVAGALDYQGLSEGKTAFMIELGGGGRYEPSAVKSGTDGLLALSREIGLSARVASTDKSSICRITGRRHVMADSAGFFFAETAAGSMLPADELLARTMNIYGDTVSRIKFKDDCIVIAIRKEPIVHTGDRIAFIGTEWDHIDV
jgi:predicted deacylase